MIERPRHAVLMLAIRKRYRWTQADLAQQLNVSPRTVLRWELGYKDPPTYLMSALRELLQTDTMSVSASLST